MKENFNIFILRIWICQWNFAHCHFRGHSTFSSFFLTYKTYVTFYPLPPPSYVQKMMKFSDHHLLYGSELTITINHCYHWLCPLNNAKLNYNILITWTSKFKIFTPFSPLTYVLYVRKNYENVERPPTCMIYITRKDLCEKLFKQWHSQLGAAVKNYQSTLQNVLFLNPKLWIIFYRMFLVGE